MRGEKESGCSEECVLNVAGRGGEAMWVQVRDCRERRTAPMINGR